MSDITQKSKAYVIEHPMSEDTDAIFGILVIANIAIGVVTGFLTRPAIGVLIGAGVAVAWCLIALIALWFYSINKNIHKELKRLADAMEATNKKGH